MLKKRIMIIDDEDVVRRAMGEMFADDYHVEFAKNGSEGLFKIRDNNYDLIITDNHMPEMSGVEMLETHSENKTLEKSTPVIMYTTECNPSFKIRGAEAGVNYWIIKPFNLLGFYKLVTKILDQDKVLI